METSLFAPSAHTLAHPLERIAERARDFAVAARSEATRRAYRQQWQTFTEWCVRNGLVSLPAEPASVALYLTARAEGGAKVATMDQALAAISQAHLASGHESPRRSAQVRTVFMGIRKTLGVAPKKKAPLLVPALKRMISGLPPGMAGARDKALLLLGFVGAFRRSELVSIHVEHLTFEADGLRVLLLRSKTDQEGQGATIAIPFGDRLETCPVRAVRAWLDLSCITSGPLFRAVNKSGRLQPSALGARSVALLLKKHVVPLGLDAKDFAGHSLRAGFATQAAKAGKQERDIMRQTRHKSERVARGYIRDAHLFKDNAAKGIGL